MRIGNITGMSSLHPVSSYVIGNKPSGGAESCDRVELTATQDPPQTRFAKELAARISNEVRTTHKSAEELTELRTDIADNTYRWDSSEIAARMMLYGSEMV